ncbi:MAG: 3-oxoacyl-[acyl-carrier-protein] synthase-3 [Planctomycetota bacterium]|jgi:3-oxoacyl-[acyl-carrier-protein] synthase-3
MASITRVGIAGTGSYLPERVVPNAWFEEFLDTSDEWITQRTGIKFRRYAAEDEATSDLCVKASERALEAAEIDAADIDLVICGTLSGDHVIPATACLVQDRLGMKKAGAFDVNAACTGFLTALHTGEAFISAGRAKRVLVLGAETLSRFVDFKDRSSAVIFGDGAGAAVLTPHADCGRGEILRTTLGADGSGGDFIHIKAGGSRKPATAETVAAGEHFIRMQGREVYRFAVKQMTTLIREMTKDHEPEELSLIVPHQVNKRIIDAALERLEIPVEKVLVNIAEFANTSAATVPIALDQAVRENRLEKGKLVVLVAFGAGLTWGATQLRW